MARPTECTPEVQRKIVQAILGGNYFETACRYASIAPATGYEWLARGEGRDRLRERSAVYAEFADAVRAAEAQMEVGVVAQIRTDIAATPRLGLDFLARRFPDRWGPKERVEHTGAEGGPIQLQVVEQIVTHRDPDGTTASGAG